MKTMKKIMATALCLMGTLCAEAQAVRTVLTAEVYGWTQEMVRFDCAQTPFLSAEFHRNPGEVHHYAFDLEEPACMFVNGREQVLLCPGDSVHVKLTYNGKNIVERIYSGTPAGVAQNQLWASLNQEKQKLRFKQQLLTCLVLDTKPAKRIEDARAIHAIAQTMIDTAQVAQEAKQYIMATIDNDLYLSLMEYPQMYAKGRGLAIEQQGIGNYWTVLGDWKPQPTPTMLLNPDYINLLMRYYVYENERLAHAEGRVWTRESKFEDMYAGFAQFFLQDEVRDAVLYNLICNFIRMGKEIERVDPVLKDYLEKYNHKQAYREILESLMQ